MQDQIHRAILKNRNAVTDWFAQLSADLVVPITSSFDMRDSQFKVANVDANIFPAGFNNICPTDQEQAQGLMRCYIDHHYGKSCNNVLLLAEENTRNPHYWDNILTLMAIIKGAGRQVIVGIPRPLPQPLAITAASGQPVTLFGVELDLGKISVAGFSPDLVVNNNDFSVISEVWKKDLKIPINPPLQLGWYQRRKDHYFSIYNELSQTFAEKIGIDPWLLQIATQRFSHFDVDAPDSLTSLAAEVDTMLAQIQSEYRKRGIEQRPFVFIKNNSGTYGLGVTRVYDGKEILGWTYKTRKKMKATKGGGGVSELIIQEGVPSALRFQDEVAEPTIYMIGCQLAGGFLRSHSEKDPTESLNSPGAVFRKLCVSDLAINVEGLPMENVYGWLACLGTLALGREAKSLGADFHQTR